MKLSDAVIFFTFALSVHPKAVEIQQVLIYAQYFAWLLARNGH